MSRRWAYDRGYLPSESVRARVISVGALEAGGTGKTPIAGHLLQSLYAAGKRPGLLTRGYGRTTSGLQLYDGDGSPDPAKIGDEPAMVLLQLPQIFCAAVEKRVVGARVLEERGCDVLVMDDGFVHRALKRDVDIVVLRGEEPLANCHVLPWGPLREPPSSLRRATLLWWHFRSQKAGPINSMIEKKLPYVVSVAGPLTLRDLSGHRVAVSGQKIVACAGIARPEEFYGDLRALGFSLSQTATFRDHYVYDASDVDALRRLRDLGGAQALVTTAKDAVKLAHLWPDAHLWVAHQKIQLLEGAAALAQQLDIGQKFLEESNHQQNGRSDLERPSR